MFDLLTRGKAGLKEAVMRPSARLSPSELIQEIKGGCNGISKETIKPTVKNARAICDDAMKAEVQSLKELYRQPNCWEKTTDLDAEPLDQ